MTPTAPTGRSAGRHTGARLRRAANALKWRLVLLFLLLGAAMTGVFVTGSRQALADGWRALARPLLSDYVDRLAADIGNPPDTARAQALADRLPLAIVIDGPRLHWRSGAAADRRGWHDPAMRALFTRHTADGHRIAFSLAAWPGGTGDDGRPNLWHVGLPWWPIAGLLALAALAFAVVRRLFKPLDDIRAGALRYGDGDFSRPIPIRRHDELGELAVQVNAMAGKLARMLEGQRALLLAISHELRSPLTRARLNAELVADGAERDALLRDLAAMRDLIADLLESERLRQGSAALQREPTDLNALLRQQVAALAGQPLATPRIVLDLDATLPELPLDRARTTLLLRNLLGNALQHGAGSTVEVRTRADAKQVTLTVRDHGPGVADDQLAQLAQPFYRPDAARRRSGDGSGVGLGLYLCRLVAQSHGGELQLENAHPGLRANATLPR